MPQSFLLYGVSDTYKTSNLGEAADYQFDSTGGLTRLITGDSGYKPLEDQIKRGIVQVWNIGAAKAKLACMIRAGEGYWPSKWIDQEQGIADESKLALTDWTKSNIHMICVEGLYIIGQIFMNHMVDKGIALGEPLQGTKDGSAVYSELGLGIVGSSRGTYGKVQGLTFGYVSGIRNLPVKRVIFTTHEAKGEDDVKKKIIFGPATIGIAQSAFVSGWFENTIHITHVTTKDDKGQTFKQTRAHFQSHKDIEMPSTFWPAKLSLTPRQMKAVEKNHPKGWFPLSIDDDGNYTSGMYQFLQELDSVNS